MTASLSRHTPLQSLQSPVGTFTRSLPPFSPANLVVFPVAFVRQFVMAPPTITPTIHRKSSIVHSLENERLLGLLAPGLVEFLLSVGNVMDGMATGKTGRWYTALMLAASNGHFRMTGDLGDSSHADTVIRGRAGNTASPWVQGANSDSPDCHCLPSRR